MVKIDGYLPSTLSIWFLAWIYINVQTSGLTLGLPNFFLSSKAYRLLIGHSSIHRAYQWLWNSSCQNKRKFFFWLVLKDCLSTRDLLRRRNMFLPYYSYIHCANGTEETLLHLLVDCPFDIASWNTLSLLSPAHSDLLQVFTSFRDQIRLPFFMEIEITMCWSI
jgi:hypothetical protein